MSRVPLTGGAYMARSVAAAAQRSVNLFSEPLPEAQGEPMPAAHYPTPGTRLLSTVGTGPIRGIRQATTGGIYCVSGNGVYKLDPTTWVGTHLGDLTHGLITPVSMVDNGVDMVLVDGTANGWRVTLVGDVFAPIVQTSNTLTPATGTTTEPVQADIARYTPLAPTWDGSISVVTFTLATGFSGNLKVSIFEDASGSPGSEITSTRADAPILNPITGTNRATFAAPAIVTAGTKYWVGFVSDTTAGAWSVDAGTIGRYSHTTFAAFPVNSPSVIAATSVACSMAVESDPGGLFEGGTRVDCLDTFFLFNKPNTPRFYWSLSNAVQFDPFAQDSANKEAYSDLLRTLMVVKRDIWLFGDKTTEIWNNVAAPDSQFQSAPDIFIDHGIAAPYSVAEYDNGVFWLSADRQGHGIIINGSGYQAKRISTYAIENEVAGYGKIDDAIGFCYQIGGHSFYVLTFPHDDKTWSYDITTGLWHEWLWIDTNGAEHRHRANCYWPINGVPVIGDWQNGNLYALDHRVFTDNGQPIKRVRSFPHLVADGKRVFYRQFLADMDTGSTPEVMLAGTVTRLNATFAAPDGTALSAYTSEVGGGWTLASGSDVAEVEADQMTGTTGTGTYQSAALILTPDYALRFNAIPTAYDTVPSGVSLWAVGRASGADTGYRVTISGDGTQYNLALAVLPSGTSVSVAMGTIASGAYTVWLRLRGTTISAQAQRSADGLWLRGDGTWQTNPGTAAVQFTDATYIAPGTVQIGGEWA